MVFQQQGNDAGRGRNLVAAIAWPDDLSQFGGICLLTTASDGSLGILACGVIEEEEPQSSGKLFRGNRDKLPFRCALGDRVDESHVAHPRGKVTPANRFVALNG